MEDRRLTDPLLIALNQRFQDFIERYERDQRNSTEWREALLRRFDPMEKFFETVKPWHTRALYTISLAVIGTVAYWIKWFWDHVMWGGR